MRNAVGDHHPWTQIVTSPLSRCAEFAQEVGERYNIPVEAEPGLMEIGFGEWEGKTSQELMESDPEILYRFWSDPLNNTPPGAETVLEFQQRISESWEQVTQKFAGEHLLMVGHAGMMRMILCHVLGVAPENMFRIQVSNAKITRIQIDHFGDEETLPRLLFHGGSL